MYKSFKQKLEIVNRKYPLPNEILKMIFNIRFERELFLEKELIKMKPKLTYFISDIEKDIDTFIYINNNAKLMWLFFIKQKHIFLYKKIFNDINSVQYGVTYFRTPENKVSIKEYMSNSKVIKIGQFIFKITQKVNVVFYTQSYIVQEYIKNT